MIGNEVPAGRSRIFRTTSVAARFLTNAIDFVPCARNCSSVSLATGSRKILDSHNRIERR
jgi:hypothetical protein